MVGHSFTQEPCVPRRLGILCASYPVPKGHVQNFSSFAQTSSRGTGALVR